MTTQIIRDTNGVIATGRFCIFNSRKPSSSKEISCVGVANDMIFTLVNLAGNTEDVMSILANITIESKGVVKTITELMYGDLNFRIEMADVPNYNLPSNVVDENIMFLKITNLNLKENVKVKISTPEEYLNKVTLVYTDNNDNSFISEGNGLEINECLLKYQFVCTNPEDFTEIQYMPRNGTISNNGHILLTANDIEYKIPIVTEGENGFDWGYQTYNYFRNNPSSQFSVNYDDSYAISKIVFYNETNSILTMSVGFDEGIKNFDEVINPIVFSNTSNMTCLSVQV